MVLTDSTFSMSYIYKGQEKLAFEKSLIRLMNQTIPDIKLRAGMRTLTQYRVFQDSTSKLECGITEYTKSGLDGSLNVLKRPLGESPLAVAINGASSDLRSETGNMAVIIFSDGEDMDKAPIDAARSMKGQYGQRVCIYAVHIGDSDVGFKLLEKVAAEGACGFVVKGDSVVSAQGMADFVEKVFLTSAKPEVDSDGDGVPDSRDKCPGTPAGVSVDRDGCPLDSDRDGVPDYLDKCPDTPAGVQVDRSGCPLDSDGDGVPDYLDKCPDTPRGKKVDKDGCHTEEMKVEREAPAVVDSDGDGVPDAADKCPDTPKGVKVDKDGCPIQEKVRITLDVKFDTGKAVIKPRYHKEIKKLADFMIKYPETKATIEGHTDNVGKEAANVKLSQARADSIKNYLVKKFKIAPSRLEAVGYGPKKPIASNKTADGRQKNRRVEAEIDTVVMKK
ncbi:MAG: OmpA family protein [Deltaproteobacteria bacterium]|nr:OmpA family protein [Deltaproteobacteria bacterium]